MNLIVSISFRNLWKQFFYIYFMLILIIEIVALQGSFYQQLYNFLDIFTLLFFGWLIGKNIKQKKAIFFITAFSVGISIYFIVKSQYHYSINSGIVVCLFLILISLMWFFDKISFKGNEIRIYGYQLFWICSSLLFWSVFCVFRIIPMYWFKNVDIEFLYSLKVIFQVATIISYLLFLRGLFCKT